MKLGLLAALLFAVSAQATDDTFTFQAGKYKFSFESKTMDASEGVTVNYRGQVLTADNVLINNAENTLHATGHVSVKNGPLSIIAKVADLNLMTGFGDFHDAILRSGTSIYLEARKLSYYAEERYFAAQAKLSICQDCPQFWSVTGASMDIQVEGVAEIHHALVQIKDVPVVYLPLFVFPVKTKRQSGFLMPRPRYFELGESLEFPYFWTLGEHADTTTSYMYLTKGGHRFSDNFRYVYSDRSYVWALGSGEVLGKTRRYGGNIFERWQLTSSVTQRLHTQIENEPRYSAYFPADYDYETDFGSSSHRLPTLETEPSLSWQSENFFGYGLVRFNQDNLLRDAALVHPGDPNNPKYVSYVPQPKTPIEKDKETGFVKPPDLSEGVRPELYSRVVPSQGSINNLPEFGISMPSRALVGPLRLGTDLRYMGFHRSGPSIDPGSGWIRTGDRVTLENRFAAPQNFSIFRWKPVVEVRADAYAFQAAGAGSSAYRGRFLVDQTFGTTLSKVWSTDLGDLKAVKHIVEPYVRWTYSDRDLKSKHPFFDQGHCNQYGGDVLCKDPGAFPGGRGAPQFDLFDPGGDIAPGGVGTATAEKRLREHHLVTLATATRVLGRFGEAPNKRIDTFFAGRVEQDFDFWNPDPDTKKRPSLGDFHVAVSGTYAGLAIVTELSTNWRTKNSDVKNTVSYNWDVHRLFGYAEINGHLNSIYGGGAEFHGWSSWTFFGDTYVSVSKEIGGTRTLKHDFRVAYNGGGSKCWFFNFVAGKDYNQKEFTYTPEIGFSVSETGQKVTVNSMMNNGAGR